jgi:hypothetical protein
LSSSLNRYPDNIALVIKPQNQDNNNRDVRIIAVQTLFRDDDGRLKLTGRAFANLGKAQSSWRRKYHSLDLDLLGCYEGLEGLEGQSETFDFSADVKGKCYPLHLNLECTNNPLEYNHQEAVTSGSARQSWILLRYMNSCNPQTLKEADIRHIPRKDFTQRKCRCGEMKKKFDKDVAMWSMEDLADTENYFHRHSSLL